MRDFFDTLTVEGPSGKWIASLTELRSRVNGEGDADAAPANPDPAAAQGITNEDLRLAIAELSADLQVMRQENAENIARLAKIIEARGS